MHRITLTGTNTLAYEAVMPHKSGRDEWDLYIDKWYCGQLLYVHGEWKAHLNSHNKKGRSYLTGIDFYTEEIQVFIGEIEKLKATPPSHLV